VLALTLAAPADAAYCGENEVLTVHAGPHTSCELALNAANKAVSYDNAYGIWPMHIHAYSSRTRRFYGFVNVGYFSDLLKWRGQGGHGTSVSFWLQGDDLI
jgi:hypothetical protein